MQGNGLGLHRNAAKGYNVYIVSLQHLHVRCNNTSGIIRVAIFMCVFLSCLLDCRSSWIVRLGVGFVGDVYVQINTYFSKHACRHRYIQ